MPEYPKRATCSRGWQYDGVQCKELATGVQRSRGDNFIYDAVCDKHSRETDMLYVDRWGEVYGPAGPAHNGGVDYRLDASRPVVEYMP